MKNFQNLDVALQTIQNVKNGTYSVEALAVPEMLLNGFIGDNEPQPQEPKKSKVNSPMSRDNFKAVLTKMSKIKQPKEGMPICDYIFVTPTSMTYTNLDETLTWKYSHVLFEDGIDNICIPLKLVKDIVSRTKEDIIKISVSNDHVTLGKHNIPFESGLKYPIIERYVSAYIDKVELTELTRSSVKKAMAFAAKDLLRPVINGVYLDGEVVVATDAHLLYKDVVSAERIADERSIILPTSACAMIDMFETLSVSGEKYGDSVIPKLISLDSEEYHYQVRAIDGVYPNYNAVIPSNQPHSCTLPRKQFLDSMAEAEISANPATNFARCSFSPLGCEIHTQDIDFGLEYHDIIGEFYYPNSTTIGLKTSFTTKILSFFACENITIRYSDPTRAIVYQHGTTTLLQMPMLLNA